MTPDSKYLPEEIDVERAMQIVERSLNAYEVVVELLDQIADATLAEPEFRPRCYADGVDPRRVDALNESYRREWEASRDLQGQVASALRRRDVQWLGAWVVESWERRLVSLAELRYEQDGREAVCD